MSHTSFLEFVRVSPVMMATFVLGCGVSAPGASHAGDPMPDASRPVHDGGEAQDAGGPDVHVAPAQDAAPDRDSDAETWTDVCGHRRPDVFADVVISFTPGEGSGYGVKNMPCVVLGPPMGAGESGGSVDVVSLGKSGSVVLEFEDVELADAPGPDLLVFENAFPGWAEPGFVAASDDGQTWSEWPCEPDNAAEGFPHCAGVAATLSNPTNGIAPTDPSEAGGDAFDLADVGVTRARFVRIRDGGFGKYTGVSGGFDLDGIAAVHAIPKTISAARAP